MIARVAVKTLAAFALRATGVPRVVSRARRRAAGGRRVLVFGYHRVCRDFELERARCIESTLVSRDTFAAHVAWLAERFELATVARAVEVLAGRGGRGRDLAVVTFDDGYREVLENALPVLREHGAPATLFLSSGIAGRGHFPHDRLLALVEAWRGSGALRLRSSELARDALADAGAPFGATRAWVAALIRRRTPADLDRIREDLERACGEAVPRPPTSARALDWEGVRELAMAGWEIGAHTQGHWVLAHLDESEMERDLRACRETIEREVHRPVRHFAYCNGYYNDALRNALRRTGFASATTTEDRLNREGDDPYRIARRVLWEGSTRGPLGRVSPSLVACQLGDCWRALGFDASEPGRVPEPAGAAVEEARRPA